MRKIDEDVMMIFLTSYDKFACQGYEVKAFRYILKNQPEPIYMKQLHDTIQEFYRNKRINWIMIILVPLLSVLILNGIFVSYGLNHRQIIIYLISVVGLLILNLLVFDFFDTYADKLKMKVMEQRLKAEEDNYNLIESKYTEIRQLKHDIRNQISVANSMFRHGNEQDAINYLNKLSDSLSDAGGICYTGISAVDSIINIKWQEALNRGIAFTNKVNVYDKIILTVCSYAEC